MNRLILSSALIIGIVVLIAPRLGNGDAPVDAESEAAMVVDEPAPAPAGGQTAIERDGSGQFHVEGDVDGTAVRFLVDTGADVVALSEGDAQRMGIVPDPGSFRPMVRTASGTGYGAPVRLDRLVVADRELADVEAIVVRGLSVSLLGQSALRRLGPVTLEGDRLLIGG